MGKEELYENRKKLQTFLWMFHKNAKGGRIGVDTDAFL